MASAHESDKLPRKGGFMAKDHGVRQSGTTSPIPAPADRPVYLNPRTERRIYTVKPGDTLGKIAQKLVRDLHLKNDISVRDVVDVVAAMNTIAEPGTIVAGDRLKLPTAEDLRTAMKNSHFRNDRLESAVEMPRVLIEDPPKPTALPFPPRNPRVNYRRGDGG
jgi:LysM domain